MNLAQKVCLHFNPFLANFNTFQDQKTKGFLVFSGGMKMEHSPRMGETKLFRKVFEF